jgi:hypothetical protein
VNEGRCDLPSRRPLHAHSLKTFSSQLNITMKNLKTVVSALLMVGFLADLGGCEKAGAHGNGGQKSHGHSHE